MKKYLNKWYIWFGLLIIILVIILSFENPKNTEIKPEIQKEGQEQNINQNNDSYPEKLVGDTAIPAGQDMYKVVSVVDGDTIKVDIDGQTVTLRLIGLDTPETVDPRKPVQCFGEEASNKAKEILSGKKIRIEKDPTQGEFDKYGRTLAYIYREDGLFYNKYMIEQGYANEYTYNLPYKYQTEFKTAEKYAQTNLIGLWSPTTCGGDTTKPIATTTTKSDQASTGSCEIKGNISSSGKIFHMPGCGSYTKTVIDESKGERWFCSEQEAIDAGWRKALNCH